MGKTFVYNTGTAAAAPGTLQVVSGLFFDGTLNNLRNTEIRKKVEGKGIEEYQGQHATEAEKRIFRKYAMERTYRNLWLKKTRVTDDSYGNDFSNVARTYRCADAGSYAVYIEGIGTTNEKGDSTTGYAWGTGETGIIGKVKAGCAKLAQKIKKDYDTKRRGDPEHTVETVSIILDVFGFSRGAAAARNFVYNLTLGPYVPKMYYPAVAGAKGLPADHDHYDFVNDTQLKNGMLPPFGHLGTAMLKAGISRALIEKANVTVRFLGVYDTVASFNPDAPVPNPLPMFKTYIGRLHLHDLGAPRRAVHFTAMNEHRENFSLTRLRIGIERNFPGVHSDVGGSYVHNATEEYEQLENNNYISLLGLYEFRKQLIRQYWFKEDQIELHPVAGTLSTSRKLSNRYSYITLHFMYDYSKDLVGPGYLRNIPESEYIIDDAIVQEAKDYLQYYTIEGGKNWEFLSDEEVAARKARQEMLQSAADATSVQQPADENIPVTELEEIVVTARSAQSLLRKLRNEYLHWSARRDGTGMDPNTDRKRREF
ncbi:MAG: DUF2235 domain-containing protein [Niabella sp.]